MSRKSPITVKNIYDYLKEVSEGGVARVTKTDVSKHFGYKASNGAGFAKRFNALINNNIIENIGDSAKSPVWKINDASDYEFKDDSVVKKTKSNKTDNTKNSKTNKKAKLDVKIIEDNTDYNKETSSTDSIEVNFQLINTLMDDDGLFNITLNSISDSLGVDRDTVMNLADNINVKSHIHMLGNTQCIKANDIKILTNELSKILNPDVIKELENHIIDYYADDDEIIYEAESSSESNEDKQVDALDNSIKVDDIDSSEIVDVKELDADTEDSIDNDLTKDEEEYHELSVKTEDVDMLKDDLIVKEEKNSDNDKYIELEPQDNEKNDSHSTNIFDSDENVSDEDYYSSDRESEFLNSDAFDFVDKLSNMVDVFVDCENENKELKTENLSLKTQIEELTAKVSELNDLIKNKEMEFRAKDKKTAECISKLNKIASALQQSERLKNYSSNTLKNK
ncbi:hypothetical protein ACV3V0_16200 [Clostridium perfringens]